MQVLRMIKSKAVWSRFLRGFYDTRISYLHIATLFTLACAQPLYSLLQNEQSNPFFIAHQADFVDITIMVVFWSCLVPSLLALLIFLSRLISLPMGRVLYQCVVAILLLCLWLPLCKHNVIFATVLSGVSFYVLISFAYVATVVDFLSVSVIASMLLFLLNSPFRHIPHESAQRAAALIPGSRPNVVLVIFDQIPLTSLLNENLTIDDKKFPNFARLANTSTWYTNAATLYTHTRDAVPSILTASNILSYRSRQKTVNVEIKNRTPDQTQFPNNFFTMLAKTHRINAFESVTALGPPREKNAESSSSLISLLADSSVIVAHQIVGASGIVELPPITDRWSGFFTIKSEKSERASHFKYAGERAQFVEQFIDSLGESGSPTASFLHVVLPHVPFEYDAQGNIHQNKNKWSNVKVDTRLGVNIWGGQEGTKIHLKLHIEQLRFVDVLLGKIMDKMQEKKLFDNSILAVTADHGIDFFWDDESLSLDTIKSINSVNMLQIPLFIKAPGQKQGQKDTSLALNIDILPTIATMLKQPITWQADGISLAETPRAVRHVAEKLPDIFGKEDNQTLLKTIVAQRLD